MKYSVALASLACVVALATMGAEAMPPGPCIQILVDEEMPARIRRVCALLSTIKNLGNAIEEYVEKNGAAEVQYLPGPEAVPRLDSGVKRQDVDHVFLRFGKRR